MNPTLASRFLVSLALSPIAFGTPASQLDRLHGIARGEGEASRWTERRVVEELAAVGPVGVDLFLALDRLDAAHPLPETRFEPRIVLLEALKSMNQRELTSAVVASLARQDTIERRLASWSLTSSIQGRESAELLFELAAGVDEEFLTTSRVQRSFLEHLARILTRDGARGLPGHLDGCPIALDPMVVEAVTIGLGRGAAPVLERLYRERETLARAVIRAVPRLDARSLAYGRGTILALVREEAGSSDTERCVLGVAGLGVLRDFDSVPVLLEHASLAEDPQLRSKAHWALVRIAGRDLGTESVAWERWWDREEAWLRDSWPALKENLAGEDPRLLLGTLRVVEQAVAHRNEIAPEITPLLDHEDLAVASAAARALRLLSPPESVPALVNAMQRREAPLRRLAWEALKSTTSVDLPMHGPTWLDWLGG